MFSRLARRRVHASWLVATLCLGICLGSFSPASVSTFYSISWLGVAGVLLSFGFLKGRAYAVPILIIAGGIIGLWRSSNYHLQLAPYALIVDRVVTVEGRVKEDIDTGKRSETVLRLGDVALENHRLTGSVWVSTTEKSDIKRGDIVTLRGKLSSSFGSFSASMFRAEFVRVERPVPGDLALTVRDWFASGVRRAIPEPEASLGVGYIVGQRRSLPEELDNALRTTGLTHIVVASGYNLTILVSMARRLFVGYSKFLAAFFSGGMTIAFMAVTGLSPSMTRAGLVTGLGLLAWYYGRRFHPLVLLPFAAAITLLINPSYGSNDLGWQLSFAAFTGVLVLAPLLQQYFYGTKLKSVLGQVFFETVCAWVCTVPLILAAFGQLSNVAILANILVLPLVPIAMLLTFFAGVAAFIAPPLAAIAGLPATLVLGYMTKVALYLGDLSWAQSEMTMTLVGSGVYYSLLLAVSVYMWRKTRFNFMEQTALVG